MLEQARTRTELFVESFRILYGSNDPYANEKNGYNRIFLRMLSDLAPRLDDPAEALKILSWANSVDIPAPWYAVAPRDILEGATPVGLGFREAVKLVSTAKRIAIVLDNAGEAVVDIAYAIKLANKGVEVALAARSKPYEVDVTVAEAKKLVEIVSRELGVSKPDIEVYGTGTHYPPTAVSEVTSVLNTFDAILVKGIANLEAFIEYKLLDPNRTIILFRAKCPVLSSIFGVPLKTPIIAHARRVLEVV